MIISDLEHLETVVQEGDIDDSRRVRGGIQISATAFSSAQGSDFDLAFALIRVIAIKRFPSFSI